MPELSPEARAFKPGVYKHFKGGVYDVMGVAQHSETPEQEFVVYKSRATGRFMVRPLAMFVEEVERDGYKGPRFVQYSDDR